MNPLHSQPRSGFSLVRFGRVAGAALILCGVAAGAWAQAYKIVGPDGRVTYTDKPPAAADARTGSGGVAVNPNGGAGNGGGLPYETRQASTRYPVTLYAAKSCGPCDQARQWLRGRGIPFSEYSINADADVVQLRQRFGEGTVPVITIGSQTLKGFSTSDLQSYADAAGYPKQARLSGYSWPAAVPLTPPPRVTATEAAPASPAAPAIVLPPPSKSGIQF